MNTNLSPSVKKWIKAIAVFIAVLAGFCYLYRHGISPVWTAVAIVMFPGLFRFIYRIACFLVSLAIVIAILSFLLF